MTNGLPSADKYKGGDGARVFRRAREFIGVEYRAPTFKDLFKLLVLNCAIRNGDAHFENFGVIHNDVTGPTHPRACQRSCEYNSLSAQRCDSTQPQRLRQLARSESADPHWAKSDAISRSRPSRRSSRKQPTHSPGLLPTSTDILRTPLRTARSACGSSVRGKWVPAKSRLCRCPSPHHPRLKRSGKDQARRHAAGIRKASLWSLLSRISTLSMGRFARPTLNSFHNLFCERHRSEIDHE